MKKSEIDPKMIAKILIGSAVIISVITLFLALRQKKGGSLNNFGNTISRLSEILENHHIEEPAMMKKLGKKLHKQETSLLEVADLIATGVELWKKFKS